MTVRIKLTLPFGFTPRGSAIFQLLRKKNKDSNIIPVSPRLDLKGNLANNFERTHRIWNDYYSIATEHDNQPMKLRTATFLTCIGSDVPGLPEAFNLKVQTMQEKIIEQLEQYCVGKTNDIYERYYFNKRDQRVHESIDAYIKTLRTRATRVTIVHPNTA